MPTLLFETADLRGQAQRVLAEQLVGWPQQYPGVPVQEFVQRGHSVAELAAAADAPRLLAVGHRGRREFNGLLGSVAAEVVQQASCPVAGRPRLEQLRPAQKRSELLSSPLWPDDLPLPVPCYVLLGRAVPSRLGDASGRDQGIRHRNRFRRWNVVECRSRRRAGHTPAHAPQFVLR
ncbi:universal stress protein [Saccharopolyspora sp. NPDC000995]